MGQRLKCVLQWILGVLVVFVAVFGPKGIAVSSIPESSPVLTHIKERSTAPHSAEGQGPNAPHPVLLPEGKAVLPPRQHSSPPDHVALGDSSGRAPTVKSPAPSVAVLVAHSRTGVSKGGMTGKAPDRSFPATVPTAKVPAVPPTLFSSPENGGNSYGIPIAAPEGESIHPFPVNYSQPKASAVSPVPDTSPAMHGSRHNVPGPAPPTDLSGPAISPPLAISPDTGRAMHGLPVAASPKALSGHGLPKNLHEPAISPVSRTGLPVAAPPMNFSSFSNHANSSLPKGSAESPVSTVPPAIHQSYRMPVAAPPTAASSSLSPANPTHVNGSLPARSPAPRGAEMPPDAHPPSSSRFKSPPGSIDHSPSSEPAASFHHGSRKRIENPASEPSHHFLPPDNAHAPFRSHPKSPPGSIHHNPASAPAASFHHWDKRRKGAPASAPSHPYPPQSQKPEFQRSRPKSHAPESHDQSPLISPSPFHLVDNQRVPAPSPLVPSIHNKATRPVQPPVVSPSSFLPGKQSPPRPQPVHALPPPPPNMDCTPLSCPEPLTNSAPGSPCACVLPINIELRLSIALYTFFPLVSEFAQEIVAGVRMEQSQVRIMGANAASQEPEKTIVLLDLVPLGEKFDNNTAFFVYEMFWHKQVFINPSFFGDYSVLYVRYPGLPPSPPVAPGNINDGASGNGNNPMTIHPFAVDVRKHKEKQNASVIAIIVLSAVIVLVLCLGAAWLLVLKCRAHSQLPILMAQTAPPQFAKASGRGPAMLSSRHSSASASFSSSIATYTGSAKTFTFSDMERATDKFDNSRIIGEGGFGRVYEGTLDDGTKVAIKIPKRDDQQGGREFLAEVEMLSRLHHRNLIKLIGICTEENIRCLVYEYVPNGSVESHLHGAEKEATPLDWNARLKIALGAARGLAYLHEDSSPRVIHRDFKSSNILLEEDFTPKVSDFGLARTALDEGKEYISTCVMGTFGYVAPEYAMTGHLLVKSDVYSYGVVLLELLTGRKPVDMLRPPGQENLVTWARPLLTSKDGLEMVLDPSLGSGIPFDCVAKVAAIASMCVQPEVNQRPFMGEVVQALKLVCSEGDNHGGSGSFSQEDISTQEKVRRASVSDLEFERVLSASDILSTSPRFSRDASGSFRRYSSSGPLRPGSKGQFWHAARGLSTGSASEHGRLGKGSEADHAPHLN